MAAPAPHRPLEVEPGLPLSDLRTIEDCDAAYERLTVAIATIERQLAGFAPASVDQSGDWRARARSALRFKKAMLPRVQEHRAAIRRQEREAQRAAEAQTVRLAGDRRRGTLLGIVREIAPEVMDRAEAVARDRHPALFPTAGEGA